MKEHWIAVPGYKGMYEVSSFGRVKSLPRKMWNGKVYWMSKERIMHLFNMRGGYLYVTFHNKKGESINYSVHRLVIASFLGDSGLEVNHIDGNKKNNNINNLEYLTSKENKEHAWKIGLYNDETRKKLSKAILGIKRTEEIKIKMSESAKLGWIKRRANNI